MDIVHHLVSLVSVRLLVFPVYPVLVASVASQVSVVSQVLVLQDSLVIQDLVDSVQRQDSVAFPPHQDFLV